MRNLLTGYVITALVLVAVDGIGGIFSSATELARTSIDLRTAKKQVEINKLAASLEEQGSTKAIGFAYTSEEEDNYEE